MYLWEQRNWPHFEWDEPVLRPTLDAVRLLQGRVSGRTDTAPETAALNVEMDALIQNAIRTSEIEGERLDVGYVRSSVARQLGLKQAGVSARTTSESEALVELLLQSMHQLNEPLSREKLCLWESMLFVQGPGVLGSVGVGKLRDDHPMQVVSGRLDQPTVHFEAPPREQLDAELDAFLTWFNHPPQGLDGLVRAGIAHSWLITLHPFDDGNDRITRAVTDRALAQAEHQSVRFYSLSAAIMARRSAYYDQLECAQQGSLNITPWLLWFLDTLKEALEQALLRIDRVLIKATFWQRHATTVLNERQIKVLNRLLDTAGDEFAQCINARKYQSLAKVSKATATRELAELLEKGRCQVHFGICH